MNTPLLMNMLLSGASNGAMGGGVSGALSNSQRSSNASGTVIQNTAENQTISESFAQTLLKQIADGETASIDPAAFSTEGMTETEAALLQRISAMADKATPEELKALQALTPSAGGQSAESVTTSSDALYQLLNDKVLNTQSGDENGTTLQDLISRMVERENGKAQIPLQYNPDTGRLEPVNYDSLRLNELTPAAGEELPQQQAPLDEGALLQDDQQTYVQYSAMNYALLDEQGQQRQPVAAASVNAPLHQKSLDLLNGKASASSVLTEVTEGLDVASYDSRNSQLSDRADTLSQLLSQQGSMGKSEGAASLMAMNMAGPKAKEVAQPLTPVGSGLETLAFTSELGVEQAQRPNELTGHGKMFSAEFARQNAPTNPTEQVAVQIRQHSASGFDRIQIQLEPAELGRVEIQIELGKDGRVQAMVSADNQDTLDLLQRDSKMLQQALEQAGLQGDESSLEFSLNQGGQNDENADEAHNSASLLQQEEYNEAEIADAHIAHYAVNMSQGLDIKV